MTNKININLGAVQKTLFLPLLLSKSLDRDQKLSDANMRRFSGHTIHDPSQAGKE
jgi:hypothetical protein